MSNRSSSGNELSRRGLLAGAAVIAFARTADAQDAAPPPATPASPPILTEQLLHSTALIETADASGRVAGTGTGFFFSFFNHNGTSVPAVVTNRHVIQSASSAFITLTHAKSDGSPDYGNNKRIELKQGLLHPDSSIDLAILPLGPALGPLLAAGEKFVYAPADQSLIPDHAQLEALTPLEDVLIIGYPDGISDTKNNIPVFRKGITATPVNLDFQGQPIFLLDAAIFPGSSGSPVFLFNQGTITNRSGFTFGTRISLLGVVSAVALHQTDGKIVFRPAPTQATPMVETMIPNNLGLCIKSAKVLDFEPLLVKNGVTVPDGYVMRSVDHP